MKPTIGNWYRIHGGDSFEVVAFDEDDGTIELQYFDGTVEEMDHRRLAGREGKRRARRNRTP